MRIEKKITVFGKTLDLTVRQEFNDLYGVIFKAEIWDGDLIINAKNTFVSTKTLKIDLINWIRAIVSQRLHESDLLEDLEQWDGVIE